jgi:pilus assembly protein Flp/PilA
MGDSFRTGVTALTRVGQSKTPFLRSLTSGHSVIRPNYLKSNRIKIRMAIVDFVRGFLVDDRGQGLVEYSLIIALISVVSIAALQLMGSKANNTLNNAGGSLTD